jgi:hypothetical protein
MFDTYKPGGGVGVGTFPGILIGMGVAVGAAFVYQLLLEWIPIIYVNFLLTLGVGVLLGMIGISVVTHGNCRNLIVALLAGLLIATAFLGAKFWFQYQNYYKQVRVAAVVGFTEEMTNSQEGELEQFSDEQIQEIVDEYMRQEYSFIQHLQGRIDEGWMVGRGGGAPISGPFVYLIWLIEAGIIYFFATSGPKSQAGEPFNEKLSKWAGEEEIVMTLPITDEEMVAKIKSASTVEQLLEIPIPKTDQSTQFAIYQVNSIEGADLEDAYLTVTLREFTTNAKGEVEKNDTPLVTHAVLTSEKRKELVENASLLQEAMEDFRQAVNEAKESMQADADVEQDNTDQGGEH